MVQAIELNLDALVGPTHNYSGLSYGNIASMEHAKKTSNPKKAALQGLEKMYTLMSLGIKQAILPPQERPFIPILHTLGFTGTDEEILQKAWKIDPKLFLACSSAACMWVANAATVSPSADSNDSRVHFTPANLMSKFHRSFEAATTGMILYRIFNHPAYFAHHHPLPYHIDFADEGAANHTRFCRTFDQPGVQLFVFGRSITSQNGTLLPKQFPARQTDEASKTLARLHRLSPSRVVFAQQNPEAIDAGVFHNDVISVGHQNLFLYHERAFVNTSSIIQQLKQQLDTQCQVPLLALEIKDRDVTLEEAVKTYLFNSQIVTLPDQTMLLLAPQECQESPSVNHYLQTLLKNKEQPIRQIIYQNIRESMQNGGGPACLRLRVVLTHTEYEAMHPHVQLTEDLYHQLVKWVEKHYRDQLKPDDLPDPQLLQEGRKALDELSRILELGSIYSFQRIKGPPPTLPEKLS
jgi:succinylarginine dihydrolase